VAPPQTLLPGSEEFAETCVQAARTSSKILGQLQSGRDLAFYGFFDALTVFSSALILMMSSTVQFKAQPTDGEAVENLRKLLEEMRDAGNMSAHDYFRELMECKDHLDQAREQMNGASDSLHATAGRSDSLEHLMHANDSLGTSRRDPGTDQALIEQINTSDPSGFDTSNLLMGPQLQALVHDPNVSWGVDLLDLPSALLANSCSPGMDSSRGDFGFH
jgi:hypothetical protein